MTFSPGLPGEGEGGTRLLARRKALASTRSPSKSVRSAILMALAGVISIGISPGTLAIVISSTSANLADLVGLGAPTTAEAKPAGDISSHRESTAEASYSGLLTDGLSLLQAAF